MNTVEEPSTDFAEQATELLAEEHWTKGEDRITSLCQKSVAAHQAALRSVAHFTNGALDFVVRPRASMSLRASRSSDARLITGEGRPGRHLVVWAEDIDRSLRRFGTGELIRLVVATPGGGMYCGRIKADQHMVGLCASGDRVPELDEAMNVLVLGIRAGVHHLGNEHLGGEALGRLSPLEDVSALHIEFGMAVEDDEPTKERLRERWQRSVNAVDLQYAAYYRDWSMVCAGDAFDDPTLGVRLMGVSTPHRRTMYGDLASAVRAHIARLRNALRPLTSEPIDRLVLDVQEGAIYIHWLDRNSGTFVLGVTVDQLRVAGAEERLRLLISDLA